MVTTPPAMSFTLLLKFLNGDLFSLEQNAPIPYDALQRIVRAQYPDRRTCNLQFLGEDGAEATKATEWSADTTLYVMVRSPQITITLHWYNGTIEVMEYNQSSVNKSDVMDVIHTMHPEYADRIVYLEPCSEEGVVDEKADVSFSGKPRRALSLHKNAHVYAHLKGEFPFQIRMEKVAVDANKILYQIRMNPLARRQDEYVYEFLTTRTEVEEEKVFYHLVPSYARYVRGAISTPYSSLRRLLQGTLCQMAWNPDGADCYFSNEHHMMPLLNIACSLPLNEWPMRK